MVTYFEPLNSLNASSRKSAHAHISLVRIAPKECHGVLCDQQSIQIASNCSIINDALNADTYR